MADVKGNINKIYTALSGAKLINDKDESSFGQHLSDSNYRLQVFGLLRKNGASGYGNNYGDFKKFIGYDNTEQRKETAKQALSGGTQRTSTPPSSQQQTPTPMQLPEGFGQLNTNLGETEEQRIAREASYGWTQDLGGQIKKSQDTTIHKALQGDREASKAVEKQTRKRLQQRLDEAEYEKETGKQLRNTGVNFSFEAPTIARDENGEMLRGENGEPLIGRTTDEAKAKTHQQVKKEQEEYKSIEDQLKEAYAEEERIKNLMEKDKKGRELLDNLIMSGGYDPTMSQENSNVLGNRNTYNNALRQVERRIKELEAARDDAGFFRGVKNTLTDQSSYSFGLTDIEDAKQLKKIKDKIDEAKRNGTAPNLTDGEQTFVDNYLKNKEAEQLNAENWWYNAGQGFGETLSFMKDFAVTGGGFASLAKGGMALGGKVGAKAASQLLGDYMTKNLGTKALGKTIEYSGKAAGLMAGAEAGGFLLNNTVQAASSAADIINRQTGNLTYDKDGNLTFEGGKSLGESVLTSQISRTGENGSELVGLAFDAIPGILGRVIQRTTPGKVLKRITDSKFWKKGENALDYLGVQSVWGEGMEEEYGMARTEILNTITNGNYDPNGSGLLDLDRQIDTWKTVGLTSMILRVPSMIVSGTQAANYYANRYNLNTSDNNMRETFDNTERYSNVKNMIDNADNKQIAGVLSNLMKNAQLSTEEKRAIMLYANDLVKMRGFNIGNVVAASNGYQAPPRVSNYNIRGLHVDAVDEKGNVLESYDYKSQDELKTGLYEMQQKRADEKLQSDIGIMKSRPDNQFFEFALQFMESNPDYAVYDNYDDFVAVLNKPSMERTEEEQQMVAAFADQLHNAVYDNTILHEEQSQQDGEELADSDSIDIEEDSEQGKPIVDGLSTATENRLQLFANNEELKTEVEEMEKKELPHQEIISNLETFRPEEVQGMIDYYNAKAKYDGYMTRKAQRIDEEASQDRERRTFTGTINGNEDKENLVTITDGENTYTLVSGNITTDKDGRVTGTDSGLMIGLDENGDFVNISDKANVSIVPSGMTLQEYEGRRREELQVALTQKIDSEQRLMPQEQSGDTTAPTEEPKPVQSHLQESDLELWPDVKAWLDEHPEATVGQMQREFKIGFNKATRMAKEYGLLKDEESPRIATNPAETNNIVTESETPQGTALDRIPKDEGGNPIYEQGAAEDTYDVFSEMTGSEEGASALAQSELNDANKRLKKLQKEQEEQRKGKFKGKTIQEKANEMKETAKAIKAEEGRIKYWNSVLAVPQNRRLEAENNPPAETPTTPTPPVDGVPEYRYDTPQAARQRGYKVVEGNRIDRQEEKPMPQGMEVEVQYSTKDKVKGHLTVSELDDVQGSHLTNGQRNEKHFLPEAQPKAEFGADRQTAAKTNASEENFRPELMLTFNGTQSAYSGSTSQTNRRGEIIQGNGRRNLAEYIYAPGNEAVARKYKDFLKAHAEELGTTAEAIEQMEKPFAHIVLDVTDAEAIRLGQFTAQDLESGGKKVPEVSTVTTKLGGRYSNLANIILNHEDPDASLSERIEANAETAVKWLNNAGIINNTEAKTLLEDKTLARQFLKDVITDQLFKDAHPDLRTMFYELPKNIQSAIISVVGREVSIGKDKSILKDIQDSIRAYHELIVSSPEFANAQGANFEKRYAVVTAAVNDWLRQINMDGTVNSEKFSNFALELAKLYRSLKDQKTLAGKLREYYDIMGNVPREGGLFDTPATSGAMTREQALEQIFGIKNGTQRTMPVAGHNQEGETGSEGGTDNPQSGERDEGEGGPSDNRGGGAGDAEVEPSASPEGTVTDPIEAIENAAKKFKLEQQTDELYNAYENEQGTVDAEGGLVKDDVSERSMSASQRGALHALGRRIGKRVVILSDEGLRELGYDPSSVQGFALGNTLYLSERFISKSDNHLSFVAGHEITHIIKKESPEVWNAYVDAVKSVMGDDFKKEFDRVRALYDKFYDAYNKQHPDKPLKKLSDAEIEEEICCDWAGKNMLTDEAAIRRVVEEASNAGTDPASLIKKVIDWIDSILKPLRTALRRGEKVGDEVKKLENAKKLWQSMYDIATARRAANALEGKGIAVDTERGDARHAVADVLTGDELKKSVKELMRVTGRSEKTVRKWLRAEQSLANFILSDDNVGFLDMQVDESVPSIWNNSDYPQGTVEFSNICRKRLPFTIIYQRLQKEFPNTVFDAKTLEDIRQVMKDNGADVACGLCFVEDRRQLLGEIGEGFIDAVKGNTAELNDNQLKAMDKLRDSKDKYVPNLYELLTLDGMKKLRREHPAVAQAFIEYNNARGMQAGRLFQAYSAYHREILKYPKSKVKSINDNGGLRIFSFSDFEAHHLIDLVQVISDCATKGIKVQGYTKVPEFAKAVKDTGVKLNRSLIAKGNGMVDADYQPQEGEAVSPNEINGKRLLLDTVEGIDVNHPDFFDATDNKNVGNILVGINDEQIRMAMQDPFVDYIIPFHSGLSESIRKQKGIGDWVNYKLTQLEKKENENGKLVNADKHGVNIYTDVLPRGEELIGREIKNARDFQQAFFKACEERGWIPRFAQFIDKTRDGRYKYTPGYEKMLIDFKLFDKNGRLIPQEVVKPIFDNEFNKQILDDYVKGEREKAPDDALYEKVKDSLGLGQPKFSLVDDDFKKAQMDIISKNNPADESLGEHTWIKSVDDIKTFDEAMSEYGENENLTPDYTAEMARKAKETGEITVYSSKPIDNGIFVTPSKMEAKNYAGEGMVYSKRVRTSDVAWIDGMQGQYAKVEGSQPKFSLSTEIEAKYPNWMDNQTPETEGKRGQNTQVAGTVGTYKKVGKWVEDNMGKDAKILDASSGLGLGTLELRNQGFDVDDIEPYPGKERDEQPTYGGLGAYQRAMDDGKQYDYVISNAVLNVIPDDWRDGVLHDMAALMKPGGKMFINTRKAGEEKTIKNKIELESPQEVLVGTPEKITSYQRFFTPNELKEYVERELGDGYTVVIANEKNSGTKGLAAVVVTKNESDRDGAPRFSISSKPFYSNAAVSAEEDAEYMKAVESGDMEKAQQMVLAAAKKAMPNTKIVDKDGNPIVVYHGSDIPFNVFNKRKIGTRTDSGYTGRGFYFAPNFDSADKYRRGKKGVTRGFYLDVKNPLIVKGDYANEAIVFGSKTLAEAKKRVEEWKALFKTKEEGQKFLDELTQEKLDEINSHDGVWRQGTMYDGYFDEVIAKESNQIKSADPITYDNNGKVISLSERFNPKSNDIRFSLVDNNPFYSNAEKAVEGIKQEKATPEQWLKMIEKNGGLKAGEDKWMGLSEWLKGQDKKSLTKQEVLDFIRENQIQIEEVNYADQTLGRYDEHWDYLRTWLKENTDNPDAWYNTITENYGYRDGEGFSLNQGTRMPKQVTDMVDRINKSIDKSNPINSTRLSYTTKGLENKKEIALVVPTVESWNEGDAVHFGDAGNGRAVAWIRFGETEGVPNGVDADRYHDYSRKMKEAISRRNEMTEQLKRYKGGMLTETQKRLEEEEAYIQQLRERYKDVADVKPTRVLVIDEIQSKRHQEGREKGYRADVQKYIDEKKKLESLPNMSTEQYKRYRELAKIIRESDVRLARQEYDEFAERMRKEHGQGIMGNYENWSEVPESVREEIRQAKAKLKAAEDNASRIPDAPFQKNWHELAMKRMLRYAAENGYDKVAWTKGEQQAERYDIGNTVKKIISYDYPSTADSEGRNSKKIEIRLTNGETMTMRVNEEGKVVEGRWDTTGKNLSDVVGKDLAARIMGGEGKDGTIFDANKDLPAKVIEGEGLRIGGEGMKGFYDQMLPRFMDKYGKKWGVKTGEVELPNVEEAGRKMWSVDVTPEMKSSVMEGQPMFSLVDTGRRYDEDIEEVVTTSHQSEQKSRIAKHIDNLVKKLGTKAKTTVYHSLSEVPEEVRRHIEQAHKRGRKVRGWYENGQVHLFLPDIDSIYQAEKTIWHETVAHHGLRQLIGEENLNKLLKQLWLEHRDGEMGKWVTERMQQNGWALNEAIEEYLAREAEKNPFKEPSLWQRLQWLVKEALHKIGFASDPTISDIQYLFWVSQNRLNDNDPMTKIKQQAFLYNLDREAANTPYVNMNATRVEDIGRRFDEDIVEDYTKEEQQIIDDAKKNGTYMKAPNGKKSNLSEKQWVRVRTKAFKKWFGDWINDPANASKVVDENGEPMVVYHSYDNDNYDSGLVYMSADKNFSGEFGSNIDTVFVNIRNPYIAKDDILRDAEGNAIMFEGEPATIGYLDSLPSDYILWLQSNYDGVIGDSNTFVVAFEANQIKSATENVGTYDRKNKDIRYDEDIEEPMSHSAKWIYNDRLNRVETVFSEAYQDSMVSLKTAQNAIAKDKDIPDSQNAYMAENLMHGKNKNEQDLYNRMFRDPLIETINKILNLTGMNWGDVDRYVYTKSGLERNREFFVRDWLAKERKKTIKRRSSLNETEKGIYDRMANRIETDFEDGLIATEEEKNKKLTESLQKAHEAFLDKVESDWQHMKEARYHDLENGYSIELTIDSFTYADYLNALSDFILDNIDSDYKPEEHDYSGFRAMFGDAEGKYDETEIIDELMETEATINTDPDGNTTGTVDELWEQIRAATRYGLERYREAGMRSDEQIDQVEQMFHWYVPMRGFKEDRGEDMYQYFSGKGNTKNYVGGLLKHAKGRGSEANYPISTIFAMTYKAISDCNQNLVNQKLYRLCQANPNDLIILSDSWAVLNEQTGLWEESSPEIPADASDEEVRQITLAWEEQMKNLANEDKAMKITGKPRFDYVPMDKQKKSEHEIDVRINGKPRKMFVVSNPRMAQALNGQLRFENGRNIFSKLNSSIKNFMASLFTSYSPTFALRNLFRDWTHFRMMLGVREGEGYAKQANKYYRQTLFKMVGLFKKYREGTLDMNNEVERDFKDFMDNGGVTGFVQMQKIDDIQKEMKKLHEQQKDGKAIKLNNKLWDYTLGAIEAVNEGIENNARFSTYRASRHYAQRTKARSAYDAKEITVNFNRKGSGGKTAGFKSQSKAVEDAAKAFGVTSQILGEGRIFFNATVQAIATTFKNFQNSDGSLNKPYIAKWAGRYAIPPFMFGLALPLINKALAAAFDGDDDDDAPYANLAEWTRRKNICIYIGNNNFITIPIGQELAAFLTLGDIFAGNTYAQELKPVDKGITDELLGAMNTFSPVDIDTKITKGGLTKKPLDEVIGRTFSVLAPLVAVQQNIGWTGRPIYREDLYKDDKYTPEYQMVYNSTNPVLVSASKYLHELGGGDDVVRGKEWSEVNPAIVQYLWEQYTGGPGKVFANTISIGKDLKDLFNGETPDFNMRKVEGLKAFVQQGDDRTSYYRVNAKWRKYKEDAEALKNKIKGYEGLSEVDPTARSKYEKLSKSKEFVRMDIAISASKYLNKMNKYINKAEGSERNALKEQYNKRVKEVVDMLDSVK